MKEKRNEEMGQVQVSEREAAPKTERKRSVEVDGEPGVVRVKLPLAVGLKAREVVAELKARGAQVSVEELLAEYMDSIPASYFQTQVLRRTPEDYYLEAASKVPELRAMLIRKAKKGLLQASTQDLGSQSGRRSRPKAKSSGEAQNENMTPGTQGEE